METGLSDRMRTGMQTWGLIGIFVAGCCLSASAPDREQEQILKSRVGLDDAELERIRRGLPVVHLVKTGDAAEVLVWGAIYINGNPADFLGKYRNVEAMVDGKSYLDARRLPERPTMADLSALRIEPADIENLRKCNPGDCEFQLTREAMEEFRTAVDWKSSDATAQANRLARRMVLRTLDAYRREGNRALGAYHDKGTPTSVDESFQTVLSRVRGLPSYFPDFYQYLLAFPQGRPAHSSDYYYWERVNFGLKPTFRVNHVIVYQPADGLQTLIANKQLYASHYFHTAIDLWMCVGRSDRGFVLLTLKGSRQDGLDGVKGRVLRNIATSRTREALERALVRLKSELESAAAARRAASP